MMIFILFPLFLLMVALIAPIVEGFMTFGLPATIVAIIWQIAENKAKERKEEEEISQHKEEFKPKSASEIFGK